MIPSKAAPTSARSRRWDRSTTWRPVVKEFGIDQVIITLPWQYHHKILRLMTECEQSRVRPRVVPDLFQLSLGSVDVEAINGIPLIGIKQTALRGLNLIVKRAFDITLAGLSVVLTAPIWSLVALAVRLDSRARSSSARRGPVAAASRSSATSFAPWCAGQRPKWIT